MVGVRGNDGSVSLLVTLARARGTYLPARLRCIRERTADPLAEADAMIRAVRRAVEEELEELPAELEAFGVVLGGLHGSLSDRSAAYDIAADIIDMDTPREPEWLGG